MQKTFSRTDVLAPDPKRLCLGAFCWVMFLDVMDRILIRLFDLHTNNGIYWCQISSFCAMFILTAICFLPFLQQSLRQTNFRALLKTVLIGFSVYWGCSYVINYILAILRYYLGETTVNINQDTINAMTSYNPLPMFICTCVLVPVTEECLVRGVIFAPLCRKKPWLAYLVS